MKSYTFNKENKNTNVAPLFEASKWDKACSLQSVTLNLHAHLRTCDLNNNVTWSSFDLSLNPSLLYIGVKSEVTYRCNIIKWFLCNNNLNTLSFYNIFIFFCINIAIVLYEIYNCIRGITLEDRFFAKTNAKVVIRETWLNVCQVLLSNCKFFSWRETKIKQRTEVQRRRNDLILFQSLNKPTIEINNLIIDYAYGNNVFELYVQRTHCNYPSAPIVSVRKSNRWKMLATVCNSSHWPDTESRSKRHCNSIAQLCQDLTNRRLRLHDWFRVSSSIYRSLRNRLYLAKFCNHSSRDSILKFLFSN